MGVSTDAQPNGGLQFKVRAESASPIGGLTKPVFKFQAARFLRWRKRLQPRKIKRIWVR
jgi:hypothetical protein